LFVWPDLVGQIVKKTPQEGVSLDMSQGDIFVRFKEVQKSYDGEILVVKNLNLEIERGEFVTMLGPSGSGKTTCLMMLAGFEPATSPI
jgi:putative spermidine/putrescine transport system ATP-binding protein